MQARGKARLGNSHNEKAPFHGGHSLFSYLPLPSLQSASDWLFRGENGKGAGRGAGVAGGPADSKGTMKKDGVQIQPRLQETHRTVSLNTVIAKDDFMLILCA